MADAFGLNVAWEAFPTPELIPKIAQSPLRDRSVAIWSRIAYVVHYQQNFDLNLDQRHVCTNLSPYFGCNYLAHLRLRERTSFQESAEWRKRPRDV